MLQSLINSLFGCSHRRTTFPLTPTRKNAGIITPGARSGAYVTCLDCGREFAYDWKAMRIGEAVVAQVPAAAAQPSYR